MRFIAFFLSLLAFAAQPAVAASSPSLSTLEQQLSDLISNKSADVGIAALDLNTGETVSIKGNTPFPMASTVKVAIAALYLAQVDHGRRSLDDTINGVSARSLIPNEMAKGVGRQYLVSNAQLQDYRAVMLELDYAPGKPVTLDLAAAEALGVGEGASVRLVAV